MRETRVWSLGREDPLEKEMVTLSSILAWRIPWTDKPGRLQSTGLQRVRHDGATSLFKCICKNEIFNKNVSSYGADRLIFRKKKRNWRCQKIDCQMSRNMLKNKKKNLMRKMLHLYISRNLIFASMNFKRCIDLTQQIALASHFCLELLMICKWSIWNESQKPTYLEIFFLFLGKFL